MTTQQSQFDVPEGFCVVSAHTTPLLVTEAYIAVRSDGAVEGGCFTESDETLQWFNRAVAAGAHILRGPRSTANKMLARRLVQSIAVQARAPQ